MVVRPNPDLLVLGCSRAKRSKSGAAIEVYDGPIFRTLRRRLPLIDWPLDVWVLSAKYGILLRADQIDYYDEVLPSKPESGFRDMIERQFAEMLPSALNRVLILAPKRYVAHLPIEKIKAVSAKCEAFSDRSGKCQAHLLSWLGIDYDRRTREPCSLGPLSKINKPFDKALIIKTAQTINDDAKLGIHSFQWYAVVEEQHIPAKRFVSSLTGIPVSSFETSHAIAFLHRNGVQVFRTGAR